MNKKLLLSISLVVFSVLVSSIGVSAAPAGPNIVAPWGERLQQIVRETQVNVTTPTGRLMANWYTYVNKYYHDWSIVRGPYQSTSGYWFIILSRVSYTSPWVLGVMVPTIDSICASKYASYATKLSAGCKFYN
jgi:hypothetical protein